MPGAGGGGHSGGGGGGSFGGGGGGYHYHRGGYYGGGFYRGGFFGGIISMILFPFVFIAAGVFVMAMGFRSMTTISYDTNEEDLQNYALERYADVFGDREDCLLFLFVSAENDSELGYWWQNAVGYDFDNAIYNLFSYDDVLGYSVKRELGTRGAYKNKLVHALEYALENAKDEVNNYKSRSVYKSGRERSDKPVSSLIIMPNYLDNLVSGKANVEEAIDEFTAETGIPICVYVADVGSVFSVEKSGWFMVLFGAVFAGAGIFVLVGAIKAFKGRKKKDNSGNSSSDGTFTSGGAY